MSQFPQDVNEWLACVGATPDDDQLSDAYVVLDRKTNGGWVNGDEADVIALGAALWQSPPRPVGVLTPVQALGLSSELFANELVPNDAAPGDTPTLVRLVHKAVTSLAREGEDARPYNELRQQAAFAAVRQLGGTRKVGIPSWMDQALGDMDHWTACDHILETVELACRNTRPGRRWVYVFQLGFVVYQSA